MASEPSEFHQQDRAAADEIRDSVESVGMRTFRLPQLDADETAASSADWADEVTVRVELGRAYLPDDEAVKLSEGSIVALDDQAMEPVDMYVAGALVARGHLQTLEDKFCVRVTEVLLAGAKSRAA
jgi:flagellar motor switch protein FliN